eukprot:2864243-Alexandrium_andersonii.AAC.1
MVTQRAIQKLNRHNRCGRAGSEAQARADRHRTISCQSSASSATFAASTSSATWSAALASPAARTHWS